MRFRPPSQNSNSHTLILTTLLTLAKKAFVDSTYFVLKVSLKCKLIIPIKENKDPFQKAKT